MLISSLLEKLRLGMEIICCHSAISRNPKSHAILLNRRTFISTALHAPIFEFYV